MGQFTVAPWPSSPDERPTSTSAPEQTRAQEPLNSGWPASSPDESNTETKSPMMTSSWRGARCLLAYGKNEWPPYESSKTKANEIWRKKTHVWANEMCQQHPLPKSLQQNSPVPTHQQTSSLRTLHQQLHWPHSWCQQNCRCHLPLLQCYPHRKQHCQTLQHDLRPPPRSQTLQAQRKHLASNSQSMSSRQSPTPPPLDLTRPQWREWPIYSPNLPFRNWWKTWLMG